MKIGLLTFHGADNYGAVLQAWATTQWLKKNGIQSEIIDYRPYEVYKRYKIFRSFSYKEKPYRVVVDSLKAYKTWKRQENFKQFRRKYLPISDKTYYTYEELNELSSSYDYYVCGSDQIWNPNITRWVDPAFYLRFVADESKKIAFAPSVAIKDLSDTQMVDIIEYATSFHSLSLREQETIDILQPYCPNRIYQVSDPVLLLDSSDYDKFEVHSDIKEDYVFLYIIGSAQNNADIIHAAENIAKREKCKLVYIVDGNSMLAHLRGKDEFGCSPGKFLDYIKNAKYVISNSFHATAFSVIFQKQFITFLKRNTGSRVRNLLSEIGLENRICEGSDVLDMADYRIDYTLIPEKLKCIRQNSEAYLLSALGIIENVSFPRYDDNSKYREAAFQRIKQDVDAKKGKYYIAKNQSETVRRKSRSGGVFTALSDEIIDAGGAVYGCKMENVYKAIHVRVETKVERDSLRGSKYIQSEMHDCFKQVKTDLLAGKKVLFSGTGCQLAGLKAFLKDTDQSNLYTIDIVCHGVPSPSVWKAYLKWIEKRFHRKVTAVDFRNKKYGWRSHYETVYMGKHSFSSSVFRILFYKHYILRPSCYICPFANLDRCSDITLGDAWGIQNIASKFNDDKGCSLLILNSKHGRELFKSIADKIDSEEICIDDFMQPNLKQPSYRPKDREQFWNEFKQRGFSAVYEKYGKLSKKDRIKERLNMLYHSIIH